jgi:hypothetical protein
MKNSSSSPTRHHCRSALQRINLHPESYRRWESMHLSGIAAEDRSGGRKIDASAKLSGRFRMAFAPLKWSWRRDLNPRPSDYKSDALPAELRQPNSPEDPVRNSETRTDTLPLRTYNGTEIKVSTGGRDGSNATRTESNDVKRTMEQRRNSPGGSNLVPTREPPHDEERVARAFARPAMWPRWVHAKPAGYLSP